MSDTALFSLEHFPQPALLIREGTVAEVNALAAGRLPGLKAGDPLPPCLADLECDGKSRQGEFVWGLARYSFRLTAAPGGCLLVFSPAPQTALSDGQLDGAIRQFRTLMGDLLAQMELAPNGGSPAMRKSYVRLFRLLDNLDFLRLAEAGEDVPFAPVTMDLAGLCRDVCGRAATLLEDLNIALDFHSDRAGVLISADPQLLERMLLELIANSARAVGSGSLLLRLRCRDRRVVLTLSDSGAALSDRQLSALLQQDPGTGILPAGTGAGLGLPVVRHIAALHGGSLLVEWGQSSPSVTVTLPLGRLEEPPTLHTPIDTTGGLNPLLVGLCDVLPASFFEGEDLF